MFPQGCANLARWRLLRRSFSQLPLRLVLRIPSKLTRKGLQGCFGAFFLFCGRSACQVHCAPNGEDLSALVAKLPPTRQVKAIPRDDGGPIITLSLLDLASLSLATAINLIVSYFFGPYLSTATGMIYGAATTTEVSIVLPLIRVISLNVVVAMSRLLLEQVTSDIKQRLTGSIRLRIRAAQLRADYDFALSVAENESVYRELEKDSYVVVDAFTGMWSCAAYVLPWVRTFRVGAQVDWRTAILGVGVLSCTELIYWQMFRFRMWLYKLVLHGKYEMKPGPDIHEMMFTVRTCSNDAHELLRFKLNQESSRQRQTTSSAVRSGLSLSQIVVKQFSKDLIVAFMFPHIGGATQNISEYVETIDNLVGIRDSLYSIYLYVKKTSKVLAAKKRIHEVIMRLPRVEGGVGIRPRSIDGNLSFDHVTFRYPSHPSKVVLTNVTFSVSKGQVLALVGQSGGGKTTASRLLLRFMDPDSGTVFLDGIDYRDIDPIWLRQNIGVVAQNPSLFPGSIRDNILYGNPEATEDEVTTAAMLANAHEFIIGLPKGYEENVFSLSGGQQQRIAIARAMLKNPAILLLDEATSALDGITEAEVQAAIARLMEGRTTIVIAHRLSTMRHADNIVVLSGGTVVEEGSHEELVNKQGLYSKLMRI